MAAAPLPLSGRGTPPYPKLQRPDRYTSQTSQPPRRPPLPSPTLWPTQPCTPTPSTPRRSIVPLCTARCGRDMCGGGVSRRGCNRTVQFLLPGLFTLHASLFCTPLRPVPSTGSATVYLLSTVSGGAAARSKLGMKDLAALTAGSKAKGSAVISRWPVSPSHSDAGCPPPPASSACPALMAPPLYRRIPTLYRQIPPVPPPLPRWMTHGRCTLDGGE